MKREKEIEELKLIIAENMATYSKAKMPYDEALRMCALGILASGYGNIKQAVKKFAEKLKASFYNMEYSAIAIDNKIDNLITELYGEE